MVVYPAEDSVYGYEFPPDTEITLIIDGEVWIRESNSNGRVYFYTDPFEILPGQVVEMRCDGITKEHTVINLNATDYDLLEDIIYGIAKTNKILKVLALGEEYGIRITTTANESGIWSADFSGLIDIKMGTRGSVEQSDEDEDTTSVDWVISEKNYIYLPLILH
jgi:hypothetical protein